MSAIRPTTFTVTLFVACLAALVVFLTAAQTARAGEAVSITDMAYSPSSVTVAVGDTVTWVHNDGETPHTVTSTDGGPLDSETLNDGDEYAFTFSEAGTYEYFCIGHPEMTASVTVLAASAHGTEDDSAAPPATGTGAIDAGPSVPWMLIAAGLFALAAGIAGIRATRGN